MEKLETMHKEARSSFVMDSVMFQADCQGLRTAAPTVLPSIVSSGLVCEDCLCATVFTNVFSLFGKVSKIQI